VPIASEKGIFKKLQAFAAIFVAAGLSYLTKRACLISKSGLPIIIYREEVNLLIARNLNKNLMLHAITIERTFTDCIIDLKEVIVLDGIDIFPGQSGFRIRCHDTQTARSVQSARGKGFGKSRSLFIQGRT
jgi:hypothetical protein